MDIKTLEALGISKEELAERIIESAVDQLLSSTGFNPETEEETRYESRFKREVEARVQKAVDAKIAALAEVHVLPRVGEMIESADMRKTSRYGEPQSPSMTFKEYIARLRSTTRSEGSPSPSTLYDCECALAMRDAVALVVAAPQ